MRSIVLIIVILSVVGGAFYFIALRDRPPLVLNNAATQPSGSAGFGASTRKATPTSFPQADANASLIGASAGVWADTLDRTGRLKNRFRSEQLIPRKDGKVGVVKPEVHFFGKDGGIVTLEGTDGVISNSVAGSANDPKALGTSAPQNGTLNNVIVRLFDNAQTEEPSVTVKIPAVSFDSNSNDVQTIDGMFNGEMVPADQMPVNVRGREFDLDGRGMNLRWNDRDGKLELLEIFHGDRLLVKDVSKFGGASITAPGAATQPGTQSFRQSLTPALDFTAGPADLFFGIIAAAPATAPAAKPANGDLYYATFDKDVTVTRGGADVGAGDQMRVVLPLGGKGSSSTQPATPAQPAASSTPANRKKAGSERGINAAATPHPEKSTEPKAPKSTTTSTTTPSTLPAEPLEVHWSGKLTVRPISQVPDAPKAQMVELVGVPAWVKENGSEAYGRLIRIEPDSGRLRISPGGGVDQIEVNDANGGKIRSVSTLQVDRQAGTVDINGAGTLVASPNALKGMSTTAPAAPTTAPATTRPASTQPTVVNWTRRMNVVLAGPADSQWMKQVTIEGNADVKGDPFTAHADALTLAFAQPPANSTGQAAVPTVPPTAESRFAMPTTDFSLLRKLEAIGTAKLASTSAQDARTLAGDRLRLDFETSPTGPAVTAIAGDGNVEMTDAKGTSMTCQTLDVVTNPEAMAAQKGVKTDDADASSPFDQIRRLVATGNVKMNQPDGSRATADRVDLNGDGITRRMKLTGKPAEVASAKGALQGATINYNPQTGDVGVPGPGQFLGTELAKSGGTSTMSLAWDGSMAADNTVGVCNIDGGIHLDSAEANGSVLKTVARSGVIHFNTVDTSASKPASATTRKSSSKPSAGPTMSGVSLDSVRTVSLIDDVVVNMNTGDHRRSTIETALLDIDLERGTVVAPKPGRMLMVDEGPTTRPSTQASTQSTTEPATTAPTTMASTRPTTQPGGIGRGPSSLAASWQKTMTWILHDGQLTMDGGVRVGYERTGANDQFRITSERLLCTLTPVYLNGEHGANGGASANGSQQVELKTAEAIGNVSVRSRQVSLNSGTFRYDLGTDLATAAADDRTPLEVFNAAGTSQVGFSSFTWNVDTGLGEFNDVGGRVHK